MSAELEMLKQQAAQLSDDERAELALMLIDSLDPANGVDDALDPAWIAEIERRAAQLDRGEVTAVPGDEVFARLRAKLG